MADGPSAWRMTKWATDINGETQKQRKARKRREQRRLDGAGGGNATINPVATAQGAAALSAAWASYYYRSPLVCRALLELQQLYRASHKVTIHDEHLVIVAMDGVEVQQQQPAAIADLPDDLWKHIIHYVAEASWANSRHSVPCLSNLHLELWGEEVRQHKLRLSEAAEGLCEDVWGCIAVAQAHVRTNGSALARVSRATRGGYMQVLRRCAHAAPWRRALAIHQLAGATIVMNFSTSGTPTQRASDIEAPVHERFACVRWDPVAREIRYRLAGLGVDVQWSGSAWSMLLQTCVCQSSGGAMTCTHCSMCTAGDERARVLLHVVWSS